jgi:hypothetical protein
MSKPMKRWARGLSLALALAMAASAGDARANPAAAQALFDEAKRLMAGGKYPEACPKLEESQRLDPGIGTQYNLAACYEALGRTASAWSLFLEVAGAAKAAGQTEREKVARQRAAALEPKLMRLAIAVPEGAPADLQVSRDGVPVGKAQQGTPVPVDPGKHEVTASAEGSLAFRSSVELTDPGASETVTVQLEAPSIPPALGPREPRKENEGRAEPDAAKTRRRSTGMMVTGIALGSAGLLAGVSGALVIGVCSRNEAGQAGSVGENCDKDSVPAGVGLAIAGGVGLAVGIPLTLIGARKVPAQSAAAAPTLLVGPRSVALRWSL